MAVELYPHNEQTYRNMVSMFKTSNRVGVVQPTGTGKSFLYLKWIEEHPQDHFAILSPSTEIFTQLQEYAESSGAPELLDSVQMISYQALLKMKDEEVQSIHPDKMVLDEFHRTGAELWGPSLQRLLDANPSTQVLGASATPVRYLDDSKDMASELFDRNLAVEMTLGEAVQQEILPTPKYVPVWYDIDGKLEQYGRDISKIKDKDERRDLEKKLEHLKRRLETSYGADEIFKKNMPHNHGKFIVFCRDREHLGQMKKTLPSWMSSVNRNTRSYVSISAQEDKDIQLQAFKGDNGEDAVKLLFTIDRLNEGVHVKGIDGVIMLRPTVSPIIYLQQMGRALAAGGKTPLIFDMVNNYQGVRIPVKDGTLVNVFEREFLDATAQEEEDTSFQIFAEMATFSSLFSDLETMLYFSSEKVWSQNLELYKTFQAELGRAPIQGEHYHGFALGSWVSKQRFLFKKGSLSEDRTQKLLAAGFVFDPFEAAWQENLELYKTFRTEFGRAPTKDEVYCGASLGHWVHNQRMAFKKGSLSEAQVQILLAAGFVFDPREAAWQENYELYKAFRTEFGRAPTQDEVYCGVNLGRWADAQRSFFKSGNLSEDRTQKLLAAGFVFDPFEAAWQEKLELYKTFQAELGRAPTFDEHYHGVALGRWIAKQRTALKKGILSAAHMQILLAAGFVLDPREATWQENYELYKAFRTEFGRAPTQVEVYCGVNLGRWVHNQRMAFKKGSLSEDRTQKLLAAGFVFQVRKLDDMIDDASTRVAESPSKSPVKAMVSELQI